MEENVRKIYEKSLITYGRLKREVDTLYLSVLGREDITRLLEDALYTEEVLKAKGCITMSTLAKELGMKSAKQLQSELRAVGVLYKNQEGEWELTSRFSGHGLTKVRTLNFKGRVSHYFVWTEKGRHFIHLLKERGEITSTPMPVHKKESPEIVFKTVHTDRCPHTYQELVEKLKIETKCLLGLASRMMSGELSEIERKDLINGIFDCSKTLSNTASDISKECLKKL